MVWVILYFICTIICCGIILYVNDLDYNDPLIILVTTISLVWPICLLSSILYGLGHCVRLLIERIVKNESNNKK